mmetsp:Transcript_24600/g.80430  ORF Transcript_24600/g.80430 Transcript_24600/m.80430 type:complete len:143 (+) Transcript_24600:379-807(+)
MVPMRGQCVELAAAAAAAAPACAAVEVAVETTPAAALAADGTDAPGAGAGSSRRRGGATSLRAELVHFHKQRAAREGWAAGRTERGGGQAPRRAARLELHTLVGLLRNPARPHRETTPHSAVRSPTVRERLRETERRRLLCV